MADLSGHEAGNGGYSQRKPTAHRVSSTRKLVRSPDNRSYAQPLRRDAKKSRRPDIGRFVSCLRFVLERQPQKAVVHVVHVYEISRNRPEVVDAGRPSKDRTGRIDCRDITVGTTQIAVEHTI